jgi:hypothetical protein
MVFMKQALRALAATAMVGFGASCSGGMAPLSGVSTNSQPAMTVDSSKACRVAKQLSPNGGFITLPSCFGFSGKIFYPTSSTQGTVTAHLTVSTHDLHAYVNAPDTVYYTQWTFTSTSSSDTTIGFYGTMVPHPGCIIKGPFTPSKTYYALFEVPNDVHPIKKTKIGITVTGKTEGHSVRGVPFVGTPVLAGVKNYVLFSSHM